MERSRTEGNRTNRVVLLLALSSVPTAGVLTWAGCSSDESNAVGPTIVSPGGTFGAEISVDVEGRGRVLSSIDGIDCPTRCFAKLIFPSAAADGATSGITLRAIATPGTNFKGWSFEPALLATRGLGPDECQPISRTAAQPAVDPNALEIKLDFGEVQGQPPAGKEGLCAAYTTTPIAYRVRAVFEDIPVPDAGPGMPYFESPVAGAVAKEVVALGTGVYWKYEAGAIQGIARGSTLDGTAVNVHTSPSTISILDATPQYVIFQSDSTLFYFTSGSSIPTPLTGDAPGTCSAVEADPSTGNILCRIGTTLYGWSTVTGGPVTIASNLPAVQPGGERFGVDNTYYYFVNDPGVPGTATIQRAQKSLADGGAELPFTDVSVGQTNPAQLRANTSLRAYWLNIDTATTLGQAQVVSTSVTPPVTPTTAITGTPGLRLLVPDTSTTYIWGGAPSTGTIIRAFATGSSSTTIVTDIPGLVSFAVDTSYIYWSQTNEGRIFRRPKN